MKTPKRNLARIYAPPAAVAAMGALWLWGDVGRSARGVVLFASLAIALSLFIGMRSERRTRRRIAEHERRLELLRTRGYDALREELEHENDRNVA